MRAKQLISFGTYLYLSVKIINKIKIHLRETSSSLLSLITLLQLMNYAILS